MKTVHIDPKRPGMLVRDDDPTAGYLVGVEAPNVARAINNHDVLIAALEAVDRWRVKGTRGDALPEPIADKVRAALAKLAAK